MLKENTSASLEALVNGEIDRQQALDLIASLTPEQTADSTFARLIACLLASADQQTVEALRAFSASAIDCCGTGGSGKSHFNTSTAVAFVLAAAGVPVAKFGNRAASSRSGSFDVLDALGIRATAVSATAAAALLEEAGLVFLFAPQVYPALARLAPLRKLVPHRTVFNFLGPLLNPAFPRYRLIGTAGACMHAMMAKVLASTIDVTAPVFPGGTSAAPTLEPLGALVTAGCGLDELCPGCRATIHPLGGIAAGSLCELTEAWLTAAPAPRPQLACGDQRDPEVDGDEQADCSARQTEGSSQDNKRTRGACAAFDGAGTAVENAATMVRIFDGTDCSSPAYDLVVLNAAAGLLVAERAATAEEAVLTVRELLASGRVMTQLRKTVSLYESLP